MKTLLILTSILVLAAGCASNKNKNAGATGAPPAPVTTMTTEPVSGGPMTTGAINLTGSTGTAYTTAPQPGQTPNNGWYTIQVPNK
jgi:hypothetical protein